MNFYIFKTRVKSLLKIEPEFFAWSVDNSDDDQDEEEFYNDLYKNYKEKDMGSVKQFVEFWFEDYRPDTHSIYLKRYGRSSNTTSKTKG